MPINLRKIDKFYLSGGWENVPKDLDYLKILGIKAILDLQFIPGESGNTAAMNYIDSEASKRDISYLPLPLRDDELNLNLAETFEFGQRFLNASEKEFPSKRNSILIKCAGGISRSPAMLTYHYCVSKRMSYLEALNYIRGKEADSFIGFGASPNQYFSKFLKEKFKDSTYNV